MYKRMIKYEDFNGKEREEEHYFNLTKAEVVSWLTTNGDYSLDAVLQRLYEENDRKEIMRIFEDLIYKSYGRKSLDGRQFDKSEEAKKYFMETEAYSVLFMELIGDAKKAAEFINGIIPKDLALEVQRIMKENKDGIPDALKDYASVTPLPVGGLAPLT